MKPTDSLYELTLSNMRKKLGLPEYCAERQILCAIDDLLEARSILMSLYNDTGLRALMRPDQLMRIENMIIGEYEEIN